MANFKLSFKAGKLAGREETFSVNEVTMGRNPAHPLSVNDAQVSRDHLRIFFKDGEFFLEDLGSTNGTYINGKQVRKPVPLKDGDLVSFGENNVFEFSTIKSAGEKGKTEEEEEPNIEEAAEVLEVIEKEEPYRAKVIEPKAESKGKAAAFFSSLPTWAVVLFVAVGFIILFCLIPFVIIEVTNQWCNLFSGFFNAISPGVCP